jgi:hypothetical protein
MIFFSPQATLDAIFLSYGRVTAGWTIKKFLTGAL